MVSSVGRVRIEVRDRTLTRVGQLPESASWLIQPLFNDVGTWEVRLPVEEPMAQALQQPGAGIIVHGPHGPLLSGEMTRAEHQATATDPAGMVIVTGVSDEIHLKDRLIFPVFWKGPTDQGDATWTFTGTAEKVMVDAVKKNLTIGSRKIRLKLYIHSPPLGPEVAVKMRWDNVLDVCRRMGEIGRLRFWITQVGSYREFHCSVLEDLTRERTWTIKGNQLAGARWAIAAPQITQYINDTVVKNDDGAEERVITAPTVAEVEAASRAWGRRIEQISESTNKEIDAELRAKLKAEGVEQVAAQAVPMDDGADPATYPLGSRISVDIAGRPATAQVTGHVLKGDKDGVLFGVQLGDPELLSTTEYKERTR
ncbi:Gp37-like protein [Salininema proteolyticum]|uniref:Gp28/Gp37-like domain-containing protein n=1 Tax=Salininema proteolyticum TaxID=1607685 RepID=A0ABV8TZ03_9ACTN